MNLACGDNTELEHQLVRITACSCGACGIEPEIGEPGPEGSGLEPEPAHAYYHHSTSRLKAQSSEIESDYEPDNLMGYVEDIKAL